MRRNIVCYEEQNLSDLGNGMVAKVISKFTLCIGVILKPNNYILGYNFICGEDLRGKHDIICVNDLQTHWCSIEEHLGQNVFFQPIERKQRAKMVVFYFLCKIFCRLDKTFS